MDFQKSFIIQLVFLCQKTLFLNIKIQFLIFFLEAKWKLKGLNESNGTIGSIGFKLKHWHNAMLQPLFLKLIKTSHIKFKRHIIDIKEIIFIMFTFFMLIFIY